MEEIEFIGSGGVRRQRWVRFVTCLLCMSCWFVAVAETRAQTAVEEAAEEAASDAADEAADAAEEAADEVEEAAEADEAVDEGEDAADEEAAEEASPTDPKRGFIMPAQKTDVTEALDDFRRYCERGTWERAFTAMEKVLDAAPDGMTARPDGLLVPTQAFVRQMLADLSPEGQHAYRLFHDAQARSLVEQATGKTEVEKLRQVFSRYFITSVGDVAADRLGEIYFEQGELNKAAECWQAVLRYHPASPLSRASLLTKSGIAFARANRWSDLDRVLAELNERHAGEQVRLGGRDVSAVEHLQSLAAARGAQPAATATSEIADLELPEAGDAAWQFRMLSTTDAKALANIGMNWGWGRFPVTEMVPPVVQDGQRVYVNLLGYHFALDLHNGKLLWRSAGFHDLAQKAQQQQFHIPEQYSLSISGDHLWSVNRDVNMIGQHGAAFRLSRLECATGKEAWNTTAVADLQNWSLTGVPIESGGRVYIAGAKQDQATEMYLLALAAADGKLQWSAHLGTNQVDPNQMYYRRTSQPSLALAGGKIYVDTHSGALVAVDAESGAVEWGFAYESEVPDTNYWYGATQKPLTAGDPIVAGNALLIKGMRSSRVYALDLAGPSILWDRPMNQSALMIGADESALYFGGVEVMAVDLATRQLKWATGSPPATGWMRPLMTKNRLYQFTSRGVFEYDKATGDPLRMFRGADVDDALGGALIVSDNLLITVSNLAITAYSLSPTGRLPPEGAGPADDAPAGDGAAGDGATGDGAAGDSSAGQANSK